MGKILFLFYKNHLKKGLEFKMYFFHFRVYDGTEIHEASSCCVAITRLGKKVVFYAPDKTAHHEVNHVTGKYFVEFIISDGSGTHKPGFGFWKCCVEKWVLGKLNKDFLHLFAKIIIV